MARSGNRRRRAGSSSFNPHDDTDFASHRNSNNGKDSTRHDHGIGISSHNGISNSAFHHVDDENRKAENKSKVGNERLRSERRYHHHPPIHQRWEGKESTVNDKEEGKAFKFQDYALYLASRAKELKEEGNRRFQRKDYVGAMEQYDLALKLISQDHPDQAILHSNRAACLMQMKPVNYEEAIRECGLALDVHPGFGRALLRRARAYEGLGKFALALKDVQSLLQNDGSHPDALEMEIRIRGLLHDHSNCHHGEDENVSQQDLRVSTPQSSSRLMQTAPSTSSSQVMQTPSLNQMLHIEAAEIPLFRRVYNDPFHRHSSSTASISPPKTESFDRIIHSDNGKMSNSQVSISSETLSSSPMQPLKLIYDHDIRLAEMPVNCKFGDLRKIVKDKFPSAKAVLIKYKDIEGDLVTITSTKELRLAEESSTLRSQRAASQHTISNDPHGKSSIASHILDQLRLHVVDVPPEQEPYDKEEDSLMDIEDSFPAEYSKGRSEFSSADEQIGVNLKVKEEHDKWLSDFAALFRVHLGIDANGRIDLNDIGVDLCSEALEEVATTEQAHKLFESACAKFREMVALGYLNWGNVYMCMARRQLPRDSEDGEVDFCDRLQEAFDWAESQYALAGEKFEHSLCVKSDFCDAMLSLGQKDFERAKLKWSLAIANQTDLSAWDSSNMLELFHNAEEQMKLAALALEKSGSKDGHDYEEGLKSHIYLLWGNILYEHSQVGFRLGLSEWKELLDASVEKFKVAGAPSIDIETALQRHLSNSAVLSEVIIPDGSARDEENSAVLSEVIIPDGSARDEEKNVHEIIQDGKFVPDSNLDKTFVPQQEENGVVPEVSSIAPNGGYVNVEIQDTDETELCPNDDENLEIERTDEERQLLNYGEHVETESTENIEQVLNDENNMEIEGNDNDEQALHDKSSESHQNEATDNMGDFANGSSSEGIASACNGLNNMMEERIKIHLPLSEEEEHTKNHSQIIGNEEEILGNSGKKTRLNEIEPSDNYLNNSQSNDIAVKTCIKYHDVPINANGIN